MSVLGPDETAFLAATATTPTRLVTGPVHLAPAGGGPARLLGIVEGRSGQVVSDWLDELGPDWCAEVASPPSTRCAATSGRCAPACPAATVVLDPFHAVRLAQHSVDAVRRRVQQHTTGHRGRTGDPLYGIRLLRRGAESLSARAYARLLARVGRRRP